MDVATIVPKLCLLMMVKKLEAIMFYFIMECAKAPSFLEVSKFCD